MTIGLRSLRVPCSTCGELKGNHCRSLRSRKICFAHPERIEIQRGMEKEVPVESLRDEEIGNNSTWRTYSTQTQAQMQREMRLTYERLERIGRTA